MITNRELDIIKLAKKHNQVEISKRRGISQPAISKLYNNALKKFREAEEILRIARKLKIEA